MSQALMDYVTARNDAIRAVLRMLAAEHELSDEASSVLDVTDAEREVDAAAARLAETTDALDRDRRPVGWNEPPAAAGVIRVARVRFAKAALRCLTAEYADESADADASAEYADEQLCLAARNLAADAAERRVRTAAVHSASLPLEWPAEAEGQP
ncbi:MAG TPA: hypothetical protein VGS62_02340 [Streptosporangiaceae bacterium]|nr:hypothetical protein [Streptosporangiaceae bacterium]